MKEINLTVDTTNKEFMFNLGRLFANGALININNIEEVCSKIVEEEKLGYNKSFNMMIKYWKDKKYSPNIKLSSLNKNGVFIICPVRNASELEKQIINPDLNDLICNINKSLGK